MNTQEIIEELTRYDRLVIHDCLSEEYCYRHINYMFNKGRKRTKLFRKVVRAYWDSKQELIKKVEKIIVELKNQEELT